MPRAGRARVMSASETADEAAGRAERRRSMAVAGGAHALHDGYTDLVYVMLPIWQAEFALSYAAVGLLRSALSGTMAAFQIPSSALSERFGAHVVLAAGTVLSGFAFCLAGLSSGYFTLM